MVYSTRARCEAAQVNYSHVALASYDSRIVSLSDTSLWRSSRLFYTLRLQTCHCPFPEMQQIYIVIANYIRKGFPGPNLYKDIRNRKGELENYLP